MYGRNIIIVQFRSGAGSLILSLWKGMTCISDTVNAVVHILTWLSLNIVVSASPGPLYTKRTDVLPQDLGKSRGREIQV